MDARTDHKIELLAPAGGFEQLRAALLFGADAVYLAAEDFGMRARAANFKQEEIAQAVAEAHACGVPVHVACNVQMMESDLRRLPAYFEVIQAAGVDALIIGDMGAFALAKRYAPECALHVSTQASVSNSAAACAWYELGASRIVCAREMTLADIAQMREEIPSDLELEAFVHGAQCMAVSGRCLISSYLTERSGNRGHCTQPCRWSYTLEEEKRPDVHFPIEEDGRGTFILNAKDLNMAGHLDELARAGVDSIKIEGRNKKAFYVACVVGAYRRALDGADPQEIEAELRAISHRPYSTGFYFGAPEQASDFDGYEQETMHVADVVACEALKAVGRESGDDAAVERYRLTLRCRNRFAVGDELEVVSPHEPVRSLVIDELAWMPPCEEEGMLYPPEPVEVANRSCDLYAVRAPFMIEPGSFVRIRVYRRSARHG